MIEQLIRALVIFLAAFLSVLIFTPLFIRKARKRGLVARDMYKPGKPYIPNMGGLVMLAAMFLGLVAAQFFVKNSRPLYVFYFVVFSFALYGLADDLLGFVKRNGKVLVLFIVALPVAIITTDTSLNLVLFNIEIGAFYAFVFAPAFIMVVANLVNMYAGYNGLALGLSMILLGFGALKAALLGNMGLVVFMLPLLGAMAGMLFFNFYPAKVLIGNVGTYMIGAGVGGFFVLADMELFAFIILIPHIINFLLWLYWCAIMHREPHVKFAPVKRNGEIAPPNGLAMKYLVARVFHVGELGATLICFAITAGFGVVGLFF
jgi:UDP-N-acetylglucosamine--dolichyl-phosphate N-acetylglucosaminephosphotransferase